MQASFTRIQMYQFQGSDIHSPARREDQHEPKSEFQYPSLDYRGLFAYPQQQQRQPAFPSTSAVTSNPMYTPPSAPYAQFPPFVIGPLRVEGGTWWYVPGQSRQPHIVPASHAQDFPSPSPSSLWTTQQQPSLPSSSPLVASSSPSSRFSQVEWRPLTRRTYQPNRPAARSEWVMWVGNVPGSVKHDELWHFFSQPDERGRGPGGKQNGVLSIFLISRTRCAFVNYETEDALHAAIMQFNGVLISTAEPCAARLVCRVRKNGDDLQVGVGGQWGRGLHVQAQAQSAATRLDDRSNTAQNSSSTTSGFDETHFSQRFFILKSITQANIDNSVSSGLWATQRQNKDVLNRAFCSATDVFLIFSVNKSGGFCGFARMQGTIGNHSGLAGRDMPAPEDPGPVVLVASPRPLHPSEVCTRAFHTVGQVPLERDTQSAPSHVGQLHRDTQSAPLDVGQLHRETQSAPSHVGQLHRTISFGKVNPQYSLGQRNPMELPPEEEDSEEPPDKTEREGWDQNFQLRWLSTEHIPFQRTQHIHNLWNHNRQVKVSRDGTEVEPGAAQMLLANWQ